MHGRLLAVIALGAGCSDAAAVTAAPACELRWDDLDASAPAVIPLVTSGSSDACPDGFDARALLAGGACTAPDCVRGHLAPHVPSALEISGPSGSGRYFALGLAVGTPSGPRSACMLASTVGWRALPESAHVVLAPLPWSADLDGDGNDEIVVWQRLPYGDAEIDNGLAPAVYRLDGARLVRDDRRGARLASVVARLYRDVANAAHDPSGSCNRALAQALDHWGSRR